MHTDHNSGRDNKYIGRTVPDVARSIIVKSFAAAVLGIIIYMSVLFIYRSVGNPEPIGYYTKTTITDAEDVKTDKYGENYYFSEDEEHVLPKADDTHYYGEIYGWDAFPEILSQNLMFFIVALFVYDAAWSFGSARKNAVSFGRVKRDKIEGVKLGVCSSIVGILAYAVLVLQKIGLPIGFAFRIFAVVNSSYLPLFNLVVITEREISGIAALTGNVHMDISVIGLLIMLIPILLKIIICFIGYEFGFRQISLKDRILYKRKQN